MAKSQQSRVHVRYGGARGTRQTYAVDDRYLAVRTHSRRPVSRAGLGKGARRALAGFEPVLSIPTAGVEVLRCAARGARAQRDEARHRLARESDVRFAGRVLVAPRSKAPLVYTENLFVKFGDDVRASAAKRTLKAFGLRVKRELGFARNAWFVEAAEGTGLTVFEVARALLGDASVELCHPETIRRSKPRAAFPQQWHLHRTTVDGRSVNQHANVVAAWDESQGEGVTIAIIDDGVDVDHAEFAGAGKVVAPRDATRRTDDPRGFDFDAHGTACAGVACANGQVGASGVAPRAKLMPIRLVSELGSLDEAEAIEWAVRHGADVISCSWGPDCGDFTDPDDPLHAHVEPLPDSTRLALDFAVEQGRGGRGCVITWAAGNGDEPVDNDGYASYPKVIAVAACDDRGKKAPYSDTGDALWCAFPSDHFFASVTPGIWTTDRRGFGGYNQGDPRDGDAAGDFTSRFGGTSSACPGAAGVAALVLARNPDLRWDEVKDVLRRSCDRIDAAGGGYRANGHSRKYGYGRLNAARAVALAVPPRPAYTALHRATQDVPVRDNRTSKLQVAVGDTKALKGVRVHVDVEHTWIGDLEVALVPPPASGLQRVVLHARAGGGSVNLNRTYDATSTPELGAYAGTSPVGTWTLRVKDHESRDEGRIRSFGLELSL